MNTEPKTRMTAMPMERMLKIEEHMNQIGETGTPKVIPGRMVTATIAQKLARIMVRHPDTPNTSYVHGLIGESIKPRTARSIVKKARTLASQLTDDSEG